MLCSFARRRTRGELRTFSAPLPCDDAPGRACCGAAVDAGAGGDFFSDCCAGACSCAADGGACSPAAGLAEAAGAGDGAEGATEAAGAGAATAAPSDAITPTTVWIGTVCP